MDTPRIIILYLTFVQDLKPGYQIERPGCHRRPRRRRRTGEEADDDVGLNRQSRWARFPEQQLTVSKEPPLHMQSHKRILEDIGQVLSDPTLPGGRRQGNMRGEARQTAACIPANPSGLALPRGRRRGARHAGRIRRGHRRREEMYDPSPLSRGAYLLP